MNDGLSPHQIRTRRSRTTRQNGASAAPARVSKDYQLLTGDNPHSMTGLQGEGGIPPDSYSPEESTASMLCSFDWLLSSHLLYLWLLLPCVFTACILGGYKSACVCCVSFVVSVSLASVRSVRRRNLLSVKMSYELARVYSQEAKIECIAKQGVLQLWRAWTKTSERNTWNT